MEGWEGHITHAPPVTLHHGKPIEPLLPTFTFGLSARCCLFALPGQAMTAAWVEAQSSQTAPWRAGSAIAHAPPVALHHGKPI